VSALDRITNHSVVLVDAHAHAHDDADTVVHSLVAAVVDVVVVDAVVHAHMAVDIVLPLVAAAADLPRVRWRPNICWRRCSAGPVAGFPVFPSSPPLSTWTLFHVMRQGSVPLWCSFILDG
jgi:hypothetical protein